MSARHTTPRRRLPRRLFLEALEARSLPSHTSWPGLAAPHVDVAGATLNAAYPFATPLGPGVRAEAIGTIANSAAGGGNVDWYSFTLTSVADVTVTTPRGLGGGLVTPVLTLYNTAPLDPNDSTQNDPYTPDGHRLLAQDDGAAHGGVATVEQVLAPGTYFVAVSGTGDHDFYPFLAGSGETGGTGDYGLLITAADLAQPPTGPGPVVVAATPSDGAQLTSSPFAIYLEFNSPIDPTTLQPGLAIGPGTNVVLTGLTTGPVQLQQNANNPADPTNGAVFNATANELQIFPEAPLAPDTYQLELVGDASANPGVQVIQGINGEALGSTTPGGDGQDYFLTFQVTGVKGVQGATNAFNTVTAPLPLSLTAGGGLTQVHGAIGDDPFALANTGAAANDVDLYAFSVTGTGHYAFLAAAETGRIGSPLQSALALFQDVNGVVTLIAADAGTGNQTQATDGSTPLLNDSLLQVGLTAGDYYLAVGGLYNLPDPALGIPYVQGNNSPYFDPTVPYSAQDGFLNTVGDYLLSASLTRDDTAPRVTAVQGLSTPGAPPTFITVQFSKPVNLRQLGYQDQPADGTAVNAVWVEGSNGVDYHPRLLSYDDATNVATFYMLDAVPNGPATLHLDAVAPDGSIGLTDLAGNWLAGSDANGDYSIPFTVSGPQRVTGIDGTVHTLTFDSQGFGTSLDHPQAIGPLFPDELGADQSGVNHAVDLLGRIGPDVVGPTNAPAANYYEVQLLQDRNYGFTFLTPTPLEIFTPDGREIGKYTGAASIYNFHLAAGTYVIEVGPLGPSAGGDLAYRLRITLGSSFENAVALTVGAAPPYAIALPRAAAPPASPAPSPGTVLVLPNAPTEVIPATTTTTIGGVAAALALPPGTLAGLSAPPVGVTRTADSTPAAGPDRLVLNEAGPPAVEGSVRFIVLVEDDASPAAGGDRLSGQGAPVFRILDAVERGIDLLFRGGHVADWLRGLWIPFLLPELSLPEAAPAGPAPEEGPAAEGPATEGPAARPAEDGLWAGGLLVAGGLALMPGPAGATRRPSIRRRRGATGAARRPETR